MASPSYWAQTIAEHLDGLWRSALDTVNAESATAADASAAASEGAVGTLCAVGRTLPSLPAPLADTTAASEADRDSQAGAPSLAALQRQAAGGLQGSSSSSSSAAPAAHPQSSAAGASAVSPVPAVAADLEARQRAAARLAPLWRACRAALDDGCAAACEPGGSPAAGYPVLLARLVGCVALQPDTHELAWFTAWMLGELAQHLKVLGSSIPSQRRPLVAACGPGNAAGAAAVVDATSSCHGVPGAAGSGPAPGAAPGSAARRFLADALEASGLLRACGALLKLVASGRAGGLGPAMQEALAEAALGVLCRLSQLKVLQQEMLESGVLLYVIRLATAAPAALPAVCASRVRALTVLVMLCDVALAGAESARDVAQRACRLCAQLGVLPAGLAALAAMSPGSAGPSEVPWKVYGDIVILLGLLASACLRQDSVCLDRKGCLAALLTVSHALQGSVVSGGELRARPTADSATPSKLATAAHLMVLTDVMCGGLNHSANFRQQALAADLLAGVLLRLRESLKEGQAPPERALLACQALERLLIEDVVLMAKALDNRQWTLRLWDYLGRVVEVGGDAAAVEAALAVIHATARSAAARRHACKPASLQLLCQVVSRSEFPLAARSLAAQVLSAVLALVEGPPAGDRPAGPSECRGLAADIEAAVAAAGVVSSLVDLLRETLEESALTSSIMARARQGPAVPADAWPDFTVVLMLMHQLVTKPDCDFTGELYHAGLGEVALHSLQTWLTAAPDLAPARHVEDACDMCISILARCPELLGLDDWAVVAMAAKRAWNAPPRGASPVPKVVVGALCLLNSALVAPQHDDTLACMLSDTGCMDYVLEQLELAADQSTQLPSDDWDTWPAPLTLFLSFLGAAHIIPQKGGRSGLEHCAQTQALSAVVKIWEHGVKPILCAAAARVARDFPITGRRDLAGRLDREALAFITALSNFLYMLGTCAACSRSVQHQLRDAAAQIAADCRRHGLFRLLRDTVAHRMIDFAEDKLASCEQLLTPDGGAELQTVPLQSPNAQPEDADANMAALLQEEQAARPQREAAAARSARKREKKKQAKAGARQEAAGEQPATASRTEPGAQSGGAAEARTPAGAATPALAEAEVAAMLTLPRSDAPAGAQALARPVSAEAPAGAQPAGRRGPPAGASAAAPTRCAGVRPPPYLPLFAAAVGSARPAEAAAATAAGVRASAAGPDAQPGILAAAAARGAKPGACGASAAALCSSSVEQRSPDEGREGLVEDLFCCPITHEVMIDPVILADGFTYERSAVTRWLARHDSSPMTNQALPHKQLVPNLAVRQAIAALQLAPEA